ncbi:MAG: hypothetical protein JNM81_02225 [Rhodospirillaceae bacterium]|nr:hypothetical protein [Rhodospirillaceae bacterium]
MPVWRTLKEVLALCWRERATALKFGAVPVAVNIILVVFFTEVAPQSFVERARSWGSSVVSMLAFSPFCVAWFRTILFGRDAVATRPFFTITLLELKFFAWMLLISVLIALVGAIAAFIGVTIVLLLGAINEVLGVVAAVPLSIVGLAVILMSLSRWSVGLARLAAGGEMDLQKAWTVTKPIGWSMAGIQMIIFVGIAAISGVLLAGTLPDFIEAVRTKTAASESTQITVQLVGTISGAIVLWLTTTMYALAYRFVTPVPQNMPSTAPSPPTPSPNEQTQP